MTAIPTPAPRSLVLADLVPGTRVRDVALVLGGTLLITVAGWIAVPLWFTPVPISLATFAVLLTGATLGPARGAASAGLYLLLGVAGVPLFADGAAGWAFASFGYILGYVLAALITGALARRRADRHVLGTLLLGGAGTLVVYACGVPWLAAFLRLDLPTALLLGAVPFLVGDAVKLAATAALLPTTWRLLSRIDH